MYQQLLVDRILARVRYTYSTYRCIVDVPYWQLLMTTAALYSCTIDTAVVWQQLYCMAIRILSIPMATIDSSYMYSCTVLVWLQPHCNSCMTAIYGSAAVRYYGSYLVGTQYCMATVLDLARSSQIQIYQQLATCTAVLQLYQIQIYMQYRYYQEFLPGMATCTCTVYCTF